MSELLCPNCQMNGTKTSTGNTPKLVKGQFCIVCNFHLPKAPSLHQKRVEAGKKAQQTIAQKRLESPEKDVFE